VFWITVLGNSILAINDGILLIATFSICALSLWRGVYIGVLFAFINLIGKVQWPFIGFSNIVANISKDIVGISRVDEILTCSDEALDNNPKKEFQIEHNAIEFEDVSYSYAENDNTINFKIKAGEKIGIAGISGSGKSTIAKLCSGLYEPSKGNIYVCGKKIKDNLYEIRNEISYANQSPYLFCTTINENIKLGNTSWDQEQIIEAAKKASVHDFVENLENKYETILSEKGNKLSGGQKQKISLARNFLKNSKILIFDEITASLDFESEKAILSILLNNSDHNSTIIFISHSSFVLDKLDKVIFINNGSVSDIGRHQDLIKTNKNYKAVFS
jgi:ATP-binding cassette subfamily B protein/subfamily B ATP-binding cassette protein MsbA